MVSKVEDNSRKGSLVVNFEHMTLSSIRPTKNCSTCYFSFFLARAIIEDGNNSDHLFVCLLVFCFFFITEEAVTQLLYNLLKSWYTYVLECEMIKKQESITYSKTAILWQ